MAQPEHPAGAPAEAAPDPSMDDILASIRRILNEEEVKPEGAASPPALPAPASPPPALPPPSLEPEEVFELEHSMMVPEPVPEPPPTLPEPPAPEPPAPEPPPPVMAVQAQEPFIPMPVPMPVPMPPMPMPPVSMETPPLVAPQAAAAAMSSVHALIRTLATERSTAVHRGGPTIEDLVREEMRPILKDWLDNHLAPMVERLVRAEIERVVSRMT